MAGFPSILAVLSLHRGRTFYCQHTTSTFACSLGGVEKDFRGTISSKLQGLLGAWRSPIVSSNKRWLGDSTFTLGWATTNPSCREAQDWLNLRGERVEETKLSLMIPLRPCTGMSPRFALVPMTNLWSAHSSIDQETEIQWLSQGHLFIQCILLRTRNCLGDKETIAAKTSTPPGELTCTLVNTFKHFLDRDSQ